MKRYKLNYSLYFIALIIISGCTNSPVPDEEAATEEDNLIQISVEQFNADNMKVGEITNHLFAEVVTCNGYIKAAPSGMAQVSSQISGIVESIHCAPGDFVKKGQVLCKLSSIALIELQQEFAETAANLKRLKTDWERSKALYDEKIGAEKDFIAIENQYKISNAKYQSLKLRLELLKLNVSKIEDGELYSSFSISAPISGYVTFQNIIIGEFIEQQKNLLEIIDVNQLQLQLSVFENDVKNMKIGQLLEFSSVGESGFIHQATLTSIGKTIDMETKTIQCIAKIENANKLSLVNHAYIEAKIIVDQNEADALPSEAIIKSGKNYYVLILEKSDEQYYYLKKVGVHIGRISDGFTEIIDNKTLSNVITKGVYNLSSE